MSNEAKVLSGIGLVSIILIVIAAFSFGGKSSPDKSVETKKVDQKILVREDSHKIAAKDAKVTVVEFGDFQCPACGAAYPTITQVLSEYKGKINFVFRQYPLPMHKNAKLAAMSAEAAGEQGKFFEMYDKLYENQEEWGETDKAAEYFDTYANEIKLDMDKFKVAQKDKKYEQKIAQDQADGDTAGVSATPTFYINGKQIVGGLDFNEFKKEIDATLAGK